MIDLALGLITNQLNQHLRHRFQLGEDIAILTTLLNQDGSPAPQSNNKVILFLAGIQPNNTNHHVLNEVGSEHNISSYFGIENWNLLVMCAANHSGNNYPEALKLLSSTIQFFQNHSVFNRENTPSMDSQLSKLILSIEDISASEINSLWGAHNNGRYLPSVVYRVQVFTTPTENQP